MIEMYKLFLGGGCAGVAFPLGVPREARPRQHGLCLTMNPEFSRHFHRVDVHRRLRVQALERIQLFHNIHDDAQIESDYSVSVLNRR